MYYTPGDTSKKKKLIDKKLIDMLYEMADPRKEALIKIYNDYKDLFYYAQGSSNNHQAWEGGYVDHIADIIRINYAYYKALTEEFGQQKFTRDSTTIALFFHDMEKPFRYGPKGDERCEKWRKKYYETNSDWEDIKWLIIEEMKNEYNFSLTDDEINALTYTHGEGDDHKKDRRVSYPLAAHVHHCDNTSARIRHDDGKGLG